MEEGDWGRGANASGGSEWYECPNGNVKIAITPETLYLTNHP